VRIGFLYSTRSAQRHVHRRFRQFRSEATLVELGDDRPLQLVAFVDEGDAEGKADVLEDSAFSAQMITVRGS